MERSATASQKWLTRERLVAYATILTIAELGVFAFCVAGAHGLIVPLEQAGSTDFVSFHAAGALANAGTPWLAYDRVAHQAAEQAAIGFATPYNYFYYPPVFLMICAQLARLPYLAAYLLFQVTAGIACFLAARLIRSDLPPIVMLAFPALWWTIGTGQNALLSAALFAAGTAWVDRRPWLAGLCLGALCYKPHFGLLIPVALIAGGHWRAFAGAAIAAAVLIGLSVALFGVTTWEAFLAAASRSDQVYAAKAIFMGGLTSPYGVLMALGLGREVAFAAQGGVILFAAGVVAVVWRRLASLPSRAAVLLAATPVAVPVLMFYDLMLVFLALLWLTLVPPDPARTPWRTIVMAAVFLLPLVSGNLTTDMNMGVAALTAAMAFGLTLAVAWRAPGQSHPAASRAVIVPG